MMTDTINKREQAMRDTIYRDEAVEICERWRQRAKEHHDRDGWYMADILLRFMKEMPSADRPQEWIPCSERLPSENDEYIITMGKDSLNKEGYVTWAMFDKLKKKFYFPGGRVNYYIAVTAWMPSPESYMKGADDE